MLMILMSICLSLSLHIFMVGESIVWNFICFCIWFLLTVSVAALNANSYWDILMIMIVMLTALFLIFFYIASVNPEMPQSFFVKKHSLIWVGILLIIFSCPLYTLCKLNETVTTMNSNCNNSMNEFFSWVYPLKILFLSLSILILLLFLVMIFVRMTHFKKKGGMRGKFF